MGTRVSNYWYLRIRENLISNNQVVAKRKTAFPPINIADGLHYVVAKKDFEVNSNHEQKLWDEAPLQNGQNIYY